MHIPVDILSTVTTKTDSGSGVRQRTGSGLENNSSRFERMFEDELAKYEPRFTEKGSNTEDGKEVKSLTETNKAEKEDNTDETLAAGIMVNLQNEVVFILEGDSKSAINTGLHIENNTEPPETNQIVIPENKEANPVINTEITTQSPEYAQVADAVKAEAAMTKPETANTETINATGEVMARMPETRTQDSQNNKENNSGFFEKGNPSPLENENEKAQKVVGQKEKVYTDAAEAAKSAAEDKAEPAIVANEIAPPLNESIKIVQFQATQQMAQAALNTPVKTENLFQEMISRVEMMQNDSKSTMTIQLNPEFLGKVALEVAVDAAGLHVKINAEDSGVRSMINGQLTTLIESLENKGIEVVEVEVAYTGLNYGSLKDPREGEHQQSRQQQSVRREVNSKDGVAYYAVMPDLLDYYLDVGVSSMEFSA